MCIFVQHISEEKDYCKQNGMVKEDCAFKRKQTSSAVSLSKDLIHICQSEVLQLGIRACTLRKIYPSIFKRSINNFTETCTCYTLIRNIICFILLIIPEKSLNF